jgi:hypothetical protein
MSFLRRRLTLISHTGAAVLVLFGVLLATGELAQVSARLAQFSPAL